MEALIVGLAAAAVVLVAVLLFTTHAAARRREEAERRHQEQLAELQLILAQSQGEAATRIAAQVGETIDRFHRTLGEFSQQVSKGQSSTGEALQKGLEEARRTLTDQLRGLVGEVNQQLARSQESFGKQFEGATKVFGEVQGQLGQVAEMAQRMELLGQEISQLQGILKAPKLRGQLGEATLEEFLRQVLPPDFFELQHHFADGSAVDAVIRLREHLVPIDAKFPLESFQRLLAAEDDTTRKTARREFERSVKGRVDEIAGKYIRPGEGTFEFGLMFIPAENVYYEVIVREGVGSDEGSLLNYALGKRVVPVSPNSFYAYLMTIVTGLKGMKVEARAREILTELGHLQREFGRFGESFRVLGKHLSSAQGKYDEADKVAGKISDRLEKVTGSAVEPQLPDGEEVRLPAGDLDAADS